jgi:hypothetical protein
MKKEKTILFVFFYIVIQTYCMGQKTKQEVLNIRHSYKNFNYIPDSGYVSSEVIALKLAKVVLASIYGESTSKVYEAHLIENDTIWVVLGINPKGTLGGIQYIEIRKKDGRILKVANSK